MTTSPRPTRPLYLQWWAIGLVGVGGAAGTAGRAGVELGLGTIETGIGTLPLATLTVNLVGAAFLGWLLEALTRLGPDSGRRRALRLLLGTGFCGGFTTYSSFATGTAELLEGSAGLLALSYVLATVVVGAAATVGGIALAAWWHRRRPEPGPKSAPEREEAP